MKEMDMSDKIERAMNEEIEEEPSIYETPDEKITDPRKETKEDAPEHVPSPEELEQPIEAFYKFPIPLGQDIFGYFDARREWLINELTDVNLIRGKLIGIEPTVIMPEPKDPPGVDD